MVPLHIWLMSASYFKLGISGCHLYSQSVALWWREKAYPTDISISYLWYIYLSVHTRQTAVSCLYVFLLWVMRNILILPNHFTYEWLQISASYWFYPSASLSDQILLIINSAMLHLYSYPVDDIPRSTILMFRVSKHIVILWIVVSFPWKCISGLFATIYFCPLA